MIKKQMVQNQMTWAAIQMLKSYIEYLSEGLKQADINNAPDNYKTSETNLN